MHISYIPVNGWFSRMYSHTYKQYIFLFICNHPGVDRMWDSHRYSHSSVFFDISVLIIFYLLLGDDITYFL